MKPTIARSAQRIMFRTKATTTEATVKRSVTRKIIAYSGGGLALLGISYMTFHPKERKLLKSMVGSAVRFSRSLKVGLTISMDYWIAPIMGYADNEVHARAADRIVQGCLANGGLYIKLGQGLAAINHILPKEYTDALSILQDKCLTRESDEVETIFMEDFGKKPSEVFRSIEPEPVAAASLAQVYKGVTLEGDPVAIKVQYIDLQDRFYSDMKTLEYLLQIVRLMHPKFNLHWIFDELFETLAQELDFQIEGKNSEKCADDLKKFKYAYVPKVHWNLSTERILTTEWIDGIKINDVKKMKEEGLDMTDVDTKLISLMAEQIFHTGFVHADPHPGNVLVRKGRDRQAQIVLLDHGLYEYLTEKTRISLCNFWESIVLKDYNTLKACAKELNVADPVLLAEMLTQAPFSISVVSKSELGQMSMDEYMVQQAQQRFDKITATLRSMPKTLMLTIRNLNTVRAITRDHGDTVDRYKLMARIAVSGKYKIANQTYRKKVIRYVSRMRFEIHLWLHCFLQWLLKMYLSLLHLLGYNVQKTMELLAA